MSELPLVTVVTITYNLIKAGRAGYIRQVIECVQNQTYKNIEHIIIDGASSDGTLDIFKEYPHLKVFSQKDNGVYDAMNKGVSHAKGKYIAFLNSDDFWSDNRAVEVSVKALEEEGGDFSYAPASYVDENDKFLGYVYPKLETFYSLMPFCHQTMFTKTQLVKFDTTYRCAGDYNFIVNLLLNGAKGVFVPLNFTCFRFIGISCGRDNKFGNDSGKLAYKECKRALSEVLGSKFNIPKKNAEIIVSSHYVKRDCLEKIVQVLNSSLAERIRKDYLTQTGEIISLGRLPKFGKIKVLFNARDLNTEEARKWIKTVQSHYDCEIFLYAEPDVVIPDEYKHFPLYEGLSSYVDLFCSPVSTVPQKIKKAAIPLLVDETDLKLHCNNLTNLIIKGSYKYRLGKFVFVKQRILHGYDEYLLLNCIPLWKTTVCNGHKRFYLFGFIKIFEKKYSA